MSTANSDTCGTEWTDPFGEVERCGLPVVHTYPCVATWAVGTAVDPHKNGRIQS